MARMIQVTDRYDQWNCFDYKTIDEAVAWFQGVKADLPAESQAGATVEINLKQSYGESYDVNILICYQRQETEEEAAARAVREVEQADRQRAINLKKLAELRAKYGDQG